jgi:hypothetical protein
VYDHTRIASYWHCGARSAGERVRLLALDGNSAKPAGGLPRGKRGTCRTKEREEREMRDEGEGRGVDGGRRRGKRVYAGRRRGKRGRCGMKEREEG